MFAVRLLVLASLAVATLSACSTYKQVDDSSDGSNPKTKLHPSAVAR
jgi:uncharacterized lipoprotein